MPSWAKVCPGLCVMCMTHDVWPPKYCLRRAWLTPCYVMWWEGLIVYTTKPQSYRTAVCPLSIMCTQVYCVFKNILLTSSHIRSSLIQLVCWGWFGDPFHVTVSSPHLSSHTCPRTCVCTLPCDWTGRYHLPSPLTLVTSERAGNIGYSSWTSNCCSLTQLVGHLNWTLCTHEKVCEVLECGECVLATNTFPYVPQQLLFLIFFFDF